MEKLEVGEYIRTKDGIIAKVKNIICKGYVIKSLEGCIILDNENESIVNQKEVKHSKNIIDLIEVGDFVNNEYMSHSVDIYVRFIRDKNKIKTILTKEQYMQNCYKVEEK